MKIWLLFEGAYDGDKPGQYEIKRFVEEGLIRGHDVKVFSPSQFDLKCTGDNVSDCEGVFIDGEKQPLPDICIPRMGVATTYLGLSILRHLRNAGVIVLNRSDAVAVVADKLQTMQRLTSEGVLFPKTLFGKCPVDVDLIDQEIGFPVVVKTLKGTQGSGVYLSETPENLRDLTGLLTNDGDDSLPVIYQEFIKISAGRDLRVFVVGGKAIACMERRSTDGSFKANISRGGEGYNVTITPEIEKVALRVADLLNLDIAGVDLLYGDNDYLVCEANSAPDFKGLEQYCNINVPAEVYDFAEGFVKEIGKLRSPSQWQRVVAVCDNVLKKLSA